MNSEKEIFPHEIVDFTVEKHFQEYDSKTQILYLTILGAVVTMFIMMFFIKVDITVRSMGAISPTQGRMEIRSPISGIIDSMFVTENMHVTAGQRLMKLHSQSLDEKGYSDISEKQELVSEAEDLKNILSGKTDDLKSSLYKQQYALYADRLRDAQNKLTLVTRDYNRYSTLYSRRVVSAQEFDKYDFQKKDAESALTLIKSQQNTQWQNELNKMSQQLSGMGATITAPVSGFVQQMKGAQKGSYISSSDILGQISPDTGLIAEAYVFPKDIALIKVGTPVRLQVDAFDYNEWGMLQGTVLAISNDIFTDASIPYFKVRCQLNAQSLHLKNGYKGYIKNGMNVQARFVITHRTLYQLLYDKTDNWLNPNLIHERTNKKETKG